MNTAKEGKKILLLKLCSDGESDTLPTDQPIKDNYENEVVTTLLYISDLILCVILVSEYSSISLLDSTTLTYSRRQISKQDLFETKKGYS